MAATFRRLGSGGLMPKVYTPDLLVEAIVRITGFTGNHAALREVAEGHLAAVAVRAGRHARAAEREELATVVQELKHGWQGRKTQTLDDEGYESYAFYSGMARAAQKIEETIRARNKGDE